MTASLKNIPMSCYHFKLFTINFQHFLWKADEILVFTHTGARRPFKILVLWKLWKFYEKISIDFRAPFSNLPCKVQSHNAMVGGIGDPREPGIPWALHVGVIPTSRSVPKYGRTSRPLCHFLDTCFWHGRRTSFRAGSSPWPLYGLSTEAI